MHDYDVHETLWVRVHALGQRQCDFIGKILVKSQKLFFFIPLNITGKTKCMV